MRLPQVWNVIRKNCVRSGGGVGSDTTTVKIRNKRFCPLPPLHGRPLCVKNNYRAHPLSRHYLHRSLNSHSLPRTALHSHNPILSALLFWAPSPTSPRCPRRCLGDGRYINKRRRQRILKLAYTRDSYDLIECNQNPLHALSATYVCIYVKNILVYIYIYIYITWLYIVLSRVYVYNIGVYRKVYSITTKYGISVYKRTFSAQILWQAEYFHSPNKKKNNIIK